MSVNWDPKVKGIGPRPPDIQGPRADPGGKKGQTSTAAKPPRAMEKPAQGVKSPSDEARPKPERRPDSKGVSADRTQQILQALQAKGTKPLSTAEQALAAAAAYSMRRSRGARHKSAQLMEAVSEAFEDLEPAVVFLRTVLTAESKLHELSPDGTARACLDLIALLDAEPDPWEMSESTAKPLRALGYATLGAAFLQLATQFPGVLKDMGLEVHEAIEQATRLAEEAVQIAPDSPDGHTLLARVALMHDTDAALIAAQSLGQHALELDPEHDPAAVVTAAALRLRGKLDEAHGVVDKVIKRGNTMPLILVLRGIISRERGAPDEAWRDIDKAVHSAPYAEFLWLEAATTQDELGDTEAAEACRLHARELQKSPATS